MNGYRLLGLAAALACAPAVRGLDYRPLGDAPDAVTAEGAGFTNRLARAGDVWTDGVVAVTVRARGADAADVCVRAPGRGLRFVRLSWKCAFPAGTRLLGDAWERSYGDLGWRHLDAAGPMPWYFLATDGDVTHGYGVQVQPNALACWRATADGLELLLDLRAGGQPVRLGARTLVACTVTSRAGRAGERAWAAGRAFCAQMCPVRRLPKEPVYGYNDWYCAYGRNTATNFLADAAYVAACADGLPNRPYIVVDDGWQRGSPPAAATDPGRGLWSRSGAPFGMEMAAFAKRVAALGARPGLWYRPFRAWAEMPDAWRLRQDGQYVDPSVPGVREQIYEEVMRFRAWGFRLVKIDYLTYDVCGLWGPALGDRVIHDARVWADDTRTTAEVLLDLYRAMRAAAGDDVALIGCNALNHFAAGLFELQRTGDDTSGRDWARTRKMGPNTLAFRSIQDRIFFAVDADCVGLARAGAVPWEKNRQWLDLVARSATPLFVSWRRELATPVFRGALADAFRRASHEAPTGEPLDWMETDAPAKWRFGDETVTYDWD